jgi:hypothetical protein
MMATTLDLIKRAYRLIGVYSIGETPSADECQDALTALNSMMNAWATEKLMMYVPVLDSITLTPGQAVYTVGPSGTTITGRPESIAPSSYLEWLGVSYPLTVVTLEEYNSIKQKALQTTLPGVLWYKADYPNGTITLYPVPTLAMTLQLWSFKTFSALGLTETIALPPGYEDAIVYNLAVTLAPENEVPIPPSVLNRATMTKKLIKRNNWEVPALSFDNAIPSMGGRFNIYTGLPA